MRELNRAMIVGLLIVLGACAWSSDPSATSQSSTQQEPGSSASPTSDPAVGATVESGDSATASSADPAATAPPTVQPDQPLAIEATLVPLTDSAVANSGRAGRLLIADTEPSMAGGTVIPALPDVPCGFNHQLANEMSMELMGCEFADDAEAANYAEAWTNAFAEPNPVWLGQLATTVVVDELTDWTGRVVSIGPRSADLPAQARTDLVRQFGNRVYVATASGETDTPSDTTAPAVSLATAQQKFVATNNISDQIPGPRS